MVKLKLKMKTRMSYRSGIWMGWMEGEAAYIVLL